LKIESNGIRVSRRARAPATTAVVERRKLWQA
jgi:hypothetical protein